jgi:hypothetical protein
MGRRKRLGKLHISEIFSNFVGRIGALEWSQVESKIVCSMMIFSFFFVLFYTVTHAIFSVVGMIARSIVKVFGFIFGVRH